MREPSLFQGQNAYSEVTSVPRNEPHTLSNGRVIRVAFSGDFLGGYVAYDDVRGAEEFPYGHGATPEEAETDLIEALEERL